MNYWQQKKIHLSQHLHTEAYLEGDSEIITWANIYTQNDIVRGGP